MKKLGRNEISYLSFEGGGGAGNAYPGAISALHELGILDYAGPRTQLAPADALNATREDDFRGVDWRLKRLKGVAGASAGAINALFISLGFTPDEIELILALNDFNTFFDRPGAGPGSAPGLRPCIGGFRQEQLPPLATFGAELQASPFGRLLDLLAPGYKTVGPEGVTQLVATLMIILAELAAARSGGDAGDDRSRPASAHRPAVIRLRLRPLPRLPDPAASSPPTSRSRSSASSETTRSRTCRARPFSRP